MGEFGKTASEIIFEYKSDYADNNWVALELRQFGDKPQFNPVAACLECCTIDR